MNTDYTSTLNYLGNDINTTWQSPGKRSYVVSRDNRTFAAHPDDVAWFLTRMERGKPLFAIVEAPAPTPPPLPEPELPFAIVEEIQSEPLEFDALEETQSEPRKRTRKPKSVEIVE